MRSICIRGWLVLGYAWQSIPLFHPLIGDDFEHLISTANTAACPLFKHLARSTLSHGSARSLELLLYRQSSRFALTLSTYYKIGREQTPVVILINTLLFLRVCSFRASSLLCHTLIAL
jgi:hypothetical protein